MYVVRSRQQGALSPSGACKIPCSSRTTCRRDRLAAAGLRRTLDAWSLSTGVVRSGSVFLRDLETKSGCLGLWDTGRMLGAKAKDF